MLRDIRSPSSRNGSTQSASLYFSAESLQPALMSMKRKELKHRGPTLCMGIDVGSFKQGNVDLTSWVKATDDWICPVLPQQDSQGSIAVSS